jgi:MFS family permease
LLVLARDRPLGVLSVLVIVLAGVSGAWDGVLAPAYGQRVLHSATVLGILLGVLSAGALVGNLTYPWAAGRVDHHLLVWACLGTHTVLGYGALAATPAVPVLAAALLLAGIGVGLLSPLYLGLLTDRVPEDRHGHVFGVTSALEQAGRALGAVVGGLVLAHLGTRNTLACAAAVGGLLALLAALAPPLRALHQPQPGPSSASR